MPRSASTSRSEGFIADHSSLAVVHPRVRRRIGRGNWRRSDTEATTTGNAMWTSDVLHPGWVRGWAVVNAEPPNWGFRGIYATRVEAEEAAAEAGEDFHAH